MVMDSKKGGNMMYAVGYNHFSKILSHFILSKGCDLNFPGFIYGAKLTDQHGNVHSRIVPFPDLVSDFSSKKKGWDHTTKYLKMA